MTEILPAFFFKLLKSSICHIRPISWFNSCVKSRELSPFLLTLNSSDFQCNSGPRHLLAYSDSAVVGCSSDGQECRRLEMLLFFEGSGRIISFWMQMRPEGWWSTPQGRGQLHNPSWSKMLVGGGGDVWEQADQHRGCLQKGDEHDPCGSRALSMSAAKKKKEIFNQSLVENSVNYTVVCWASVWLDKLIRKLMKRSSLSKLIIMTTLCTT